LQKAVKRYEEIKERNESDEEDRESFPLEDKAAKRKKDHYKTKAD